MALIITLQGYNARGICMTKDKRKSSWFIVILLGICWLLIWSLAKDLDRVRMGFVRIQEADKKLAEEKERNDELKKKMAFTKSDYYREKIVREKLNMQRPGEVVVVLPESVDEEDKEEKSIAVGEEPNWIKWWNVIRE